MINTQQEIASILSQLKYNVDLVYVLTIDRMKQFNAASNKSSIVIEEELDTLDTLHIASQVVLVKPFTNLRNIVHYYKQAHLLKQVYRQYLNQQAVNACPNENFLLKTNDYIKKESETGQIDVQRFMTDLNQHSGHGLRDTSKTVYFTAEQEKIIKILLELKEAIAPLNEILNTKEPTAQTSPITNQVNDLLGCLADKALLEYLPNLGEAFAQYVASLYRWSSEFKSLKKSLNVQQTFFCAQFVNRSSDTTNNRKNMQYRKLLPSLPKQ